MATVKRTISAQNIIPLKTIDTLRLPRRKRARQKKGIWSTARFITTAGFFLLVGGTLWSGSTCSVTVGNVEIACPLGVVQVMAAARRFIPFLAVAGAGGILLVIFFGRFFCGWICPGRWIFNRGPTKNTKPWRARAWIQRAIVGVVVGAAYLCHTPLFCAICPAGVVCRGALAAGTGGSLLPTFGWLGTLVAAEWATGRSFCRDLCPLGAAFSRLSRLNPFLKVKAKTDVCRPCRACAKVCPVRLNLSEDKDLSSCTKCFACQSACPRQAIEIKIW